MISQGHYLRPQINTKQLVRWKQWWRVDQIEKGASVGDHRI